MPPLDRALALAERDDVAVLVAEQLDLDVPRPLDVALGEDAVVAERGLRLAARRLERVRQLVARAHDAHAAPAAARRRLEEQREAELLRLARLDDGHARLARDPLRLELVAAGAQRLRRRADPHEPGRVDGLGEVGVLGEEAVAGMDRVGARLLRRADVLLGVEVARRSRPSRPPRARAATRGRRAPTTATVAIPSARQVRKMRSAISPRLATRSLLDLHSAASVSANSAASTR